MSASEGFVTLAAALAAILSAAPVYSQQPASSTARVGGGYLSGVVRSLNGPEAGVWVIAETTDLSTKYAKIVVTDESGGYVLPELPAATYTVWARGYGLVDSAKVQTTPGKVLDITAVPAPTAAAAAEYYPAIYWYAMLQVPKKGRVPARQRETSGRVAQRRQDQWLLWLSRPRQ